MIVAPNSPSARAQAEHRTGRRGPAAPFKGSVTRRKTYQPPAAEGALRILHRGWSIPRSAASTVRTRNGMATQKVFVTITPLLVEVAGQEAEQRLEVLAEQPVSAEGEEQGDAADHRRHDSNT